MRCSGSVPDLAIAGCTRITARVDSGPVSIWIAGTKPERIVPVGHVSLSACHVGNNSEFISLEVVVTK
jgi:hypothetical protein